MTALFLIFVGEVSLSGADNGGQLALVLALDVLDCQDGSSLLMDHGAKARLALDDDVGDTHLSAKGWEVDDQLNWIDIMGNDNQRGLLGLDKSNSVIETILHEEGLLRFSFFFFTVGGFLCGSGETGLLFLLGLGSVLIKQFEKLSSGILIQSMGELGNSRWDLQTTLEDNLLSLEADILRPLHESGEVGGGLDVLANTMVLGGGFE